MCDDSIDICKKCRGTRKRLRTFFTSRIDGIITINPDVPDWYRANTKIRKIVDFPIIRKEAPYIIKLQEIQHISQTYLQTFFLENRKVLAFVG